MSFCEHCQGQRFDRARVLRALRKVRKGLDGSRASAMADEALDADLQAVRDLDIPHLEPIEIDEDEVIH